MTKYPLNNYERGYVEHITCSETNKKRFIKVKDELTAEKKCLITDNMALNELLAFWEEN